MNILFWNYNGVRSQALLRAQKGLLQVRKSDILGLVETKINGDQVTKIFNELGFDMWVKIELVLVGYNRGILLLWKVLLSFINVLHTHP